MQRRTSENTFISLAKRVVFRKLKTNIFWVTINSVTPALLYSILNFHAKFSTNSSHKVSFQQVKGVLQNFRFATPPFFVFKAKVKNQRLYQSLVLYVVEMTRVELVF